MKPLSQTEIDVARAAAIANGAKLWPKLQCHYCASPLGRGALWCRTDCATEYHAEAQRAVTALPAVLAAADHSLPLLQPGKC